MKRKETLRIGKLSIMMIVILLFAAKANIAEGFSATEDYSSSVEKGIRSGYTSTASLIVNYHPRIWMRGSWDWNKDNIGSFAWRIVHGPYCDL